MLNLDMYIVKRAGVDDFLKHMSEICTIYVYTSGLQSYAEAILAQLDPSYSIFSLDRLCADTRDLNNRSTQILKDLSVFFKTEEEIANTLIIDDS